jgi:hypothetical protein
MWNVEPFQWNQEHEHTLRALRVTPDGPGTVLRDFSALLEFVQGHKLTVSKARQHPTLKFLPAMNALLTHPIVARLKRPVLKSYPHLQGLYLLLRASGLAQVSGGSKPVLAIDDTDLGAWSTLNPTEQYFALLETWLLHGTPEIVGEHADRAFPFSQQYVDLYTLLSCTGNRTEIAENVQMGWSWYNSPGRMGFALLELFGLLSVEVRPPQEGETWIVEYARRTALGEAVFALLSDKVFRDVSSIKEMDDLPPTAFGLLQPAFAPYQPSYQHSLELPTHEFRPGRYTFRTSLTGTLWRRIQIDARHTLDTLATTILDAFSFDYDHLYEFSYRNPFGVRESVRHPYVDKGPWTTETLVGDLPLAVGAAMTYIYDFGDWWEFEVKLEGIEASGETPAKPQVVEARGEAPEQYPSWDDDDGW